MSASSASAGFSAMGLILLSKSEFLRAVSGRFGFLARPLVEAPGAAFERFQAQQRALDARRAERDAEVRDDMIAIEGLELVEGLPTHLIGEDRGRSLRDPAALAAEGDVLDLLALPDPQEHRDLVTTERIRVVIAVRRIGELAEVVRVLVVIEDELAIKF